MREQAESGSEHDHNSYCGDTGLAVINEWKFSQLMDFSGFYAYIYIYVRVCTFFSFAAAPCFLFVAWVLCFLFFSFLLSFGARAGSLALIEWFTDLSGSLESHVTVMALSEVATARRRWPPPPPGFPN